MLIDNNIASRMVKTRQKDIFEAKMWKWQRITRAHEAKLRPKQCDLKDLKDPGRSYREALSQRHCSRLDERRDALCERTIKKITDGNRLFYLLPQTRENVNYDLGNANNWSLFKCRTDRFEKSFSPSMIRVLNMSSWH
jgi:hypothetical protein